MKQVKIFKNNINTNKATFETQEDLDLWLSHHVKNNIFGLPERTVTELIEISPAIPAVLDEQGNEISPAIDAVYEEKVEHFPAEYTIEIEDISAQIEQERIKAEAQLEIEKGIKGIVAFKVLVKNKNLGQQHIAQLFANPEILKIINALSTGSLALASLLITNFPADGVIVTEEDKQAVLSAIL
jgi:hypothetical protein